MPDGIKMRKYEVSLIFVFGMFVFFSAMHGLDLAWNMKYLNDELGIQLHDISIFGYVRNEVQLYMQSYFLLISLFFCFSAYVMYGLIKGLDNVILIRKSKHSHSVKDFKDAYDRNVILDFDVNGRIYKIRFE